MFSEPLHRGGSRQEFWYSAFWEFEEILEFVFGGAFSVVCEPTIRSLSRPLI